jgi:anti-sigma regulatory factor (Ser/Thr protein kinase)
MKKDTNFNLIISASKKNLKKVRELITKEMKVNGFSTNKTISAIITITEHLENIIKYGYKNSKGKIYIKLDLNYPVAKIIVSDKGKKFNILKAKTEDLKERIKNGIGGKMGIKIIFNFCDDLEYKRIKGYNNNIFIFNEKK